MSKLIGHKRQFWCRNIDLRRLHLCVSCCVGRCVFCGGYCIHEVQQERQHADLEFLEVDLNFD